MGKLVAFMIFALFLIYFLVKPPIGFLTEVKTKKDHLQPQIQQAAEQAKEQAKEVKEFIKSGDALIIPAVEKAAEEPEAL